MRQSSVLAMLIFVFAWQPFVRGDEEDARQASLQSIQHKFMSREDESALQEGEKLLKQGGDVKALVADLKRRQAAGTLGKKPTKSLPKGFQTWELEKRIQYLIDSLDEVDVVQFSFPGHVELTEDYRVAELVRIGDPAVEALITVLERDQRLTRSIHFWRPWVSGTVLSTREAAVHALQRILQMRLFETHSTGDNFTAQGDGASSRVAKRLRAYWQENGKRAIDERMMLVLTDKKASTSLRREAAYNLAYFDSGLEFGWRYLNPYEKEREAKNPVLTKFRDPTVAEAIVAAMDDEIADNGDAAEEYVGDLLVLNDRRIAPQLAERATAAKSARMRRNWAFTAHRLGESAPLREYAAEFRLGKIPLPPDEPNLNPQPAVRELDTIVHFLSLAEIPETEAALQSLCDVNHPYHALVKRAVIETSPSMWSDSPRWFERPYFLSILRQELNNELLTEGSFSISGDDLHWKKKGSSSSEPVPVFLQKAGYLYHAPERHLDLAAKKLNELVLGLPLCHPLLKDNDARLAGMKEVLDRFAGRYRRLNNHEARILGARRARPFAPNIKPLDHAASADDVKRGLALFELDGKGSTIKTELPLFGEFKAEFLETELGAKESEFGDPLRVLILQAEKNGKGEVVYGVILPHAIREIPAAKFSSVKTLATITKEEELEREKWRLERERLKAEEE